MPFGVRYIAREVAIALRKKFPGTDEKEVMRAVGHLVYYRFIQPAIVYVFVPSPPSPFPSYSPMNIRLLRNLDPLEFR